MILTTIPLVSLIRPHDLCVSCNKKIYKFDRMYYEDSVYGKWEGKWIDTRLFNSSNDVERIEGHVYDYKCAKCCSDRDYNMSDRYNTTHPIKEFMI